MEETDKEKAVFTSTKDVFQLNVIAMGLCNGVTTFQRLMEYILEYTELCLGHRTDFIGWITNLT